MAVGQGERLRQLSLQHRRKYSYKGPEEVISSTHMHTTPDVFLQCVALTLPAAETLQSPPVPNDPAAGRYSSAKLSSPLLI